MKSYFPILYPSIRNTDFILQCFIYDGKTGDLVGQMNEAEGKIHKGGVYAVS